MKKIICLISALLLIFSFAACAMPWQKEEAPQTEPSSSENTQEALGYTQLSYEAAKEMIDNTEGEIILDVRTPDEFAGGYIPGAVLFPSEEITEETAKEKLPEKDAVIMVYCSSGMRSKKIGAKLAGWGYTNVYEFGGINSWPYEVHYDTVSE